MIHEVAVAFKVPGALPSGSLSELLETICRGPNIPDAVLLIQIAQDSVTLKKELKKASIEDALVRFKGRLPLLLLEVQLSDFSVSVSQIRPQDNAQLDELTKYFENGADELFTSGLAGIFDNDIVVKAPEGYEFLKPSGKTAAYFIRTELALVSSGLTAFCALALWKKLLADRKELPSQIDQILLDTMAIAPIAFSLRELFGLAHMSNHPVIETFHSYGGMEHVPQPIRQSTLCLISASSSMEMHREWVRTKNVLPSDVVTLVTFEDCKDSDAALFTLPKEMRPPFTTTTAQHHITIKGENFVADSEAPRQVLLRKTAHAWPAGVEFVLNSVNDQDELFDLFRASKVGDNSRRGLFLSGANLIKSKRFVNFLEVNLSQRIKAVTRNVIYQNDSASKELAFLIANYCEEVLGTSKIQLLSFDEIAVNPSVVRPADGVIVVSAIVGAGSALLGLSRNLRGAHRGPRLYVVGLQINETINQAKTLQRNLSSSAHNASIESLTYASLSIGSSLSTTFPDELELYGKSVATLPKALRKRYDALISGQARKTGMSLLPWDANCTEQLVLRKDFVFWRDGYLEGAHHAEVIATIAVLLQRARESEELSIKDRLFAARPTHITLDPENFTRFDDGIIQGSILRAALASELDYRSNRKASSYMAAYLVRCTKYLGTDRAEGALEFLMALCTGKMRLTPSDHEKIIQAFGAAVSSKNTALANTIRWLVKFSKPDSDNGHAHPI